LIQFLRRKGGGRKEEEGRRKEELGTKEQGTKNQEAEAPIPLISLSLSPKSQFMTMIPSIPRSPSPTN
jgi:hypothetical protein